MIGVFYVIWTLYTNGTPQSITKSFLEYFIIQGLTIPIFEEILQCVLLSFIFSVIYRICSNKYFVKIGSGLGIVFLSYLFALAHFNAELINWWEHFISFTLFGILYFENDRNILPPIVAHMTWNLILLIP